QEESTRVGPFRLPPLPYLAPMVAMWAIALGIVIVQRDLGAALLFFAVFLLLLYVSTARFSFVVIGLVAFVLGAGLLYFVFDHVRTRVDIWVDPFADPTGAGFQVVQALHAFARGGLIGTGLGAGLPSIAGRPPIPALHTDFPFAALGEERGLAGILARPGLYLVLLQRRLRIAAAAPAGPDPAAPRPGRGLMTGHERAGGTRPSGRWPIGQREPGHAHPVSGSAPSWAGRRIGIGAALGRVALALAFAFGSLALGAGYWQVIESANLSTSGDDAAVIAAARNVLRGEILDRDGVRLAWNKRDQNDE